MNTSQMQSRRREGCRHDTAQSVITMPKVRTLKGSGPHTVHYPAQVEAVVCDIILPEGMGEGVLWLETERGGVLSDPAPVLLTHNPDVAEEVQSLKAAAHAGRSLSGLIVDSLVVDIGMVLQYVGHLSIGRAGADICSQTATS